MYTLEKDYTEAYADGSGRTKVIFKAGQKIAWETAYALGMVTTKHPPKDDAKAKTEK